MIEYQEKRVKVIRLAYFFEKNYYKFVYQKKLPAIQAFDSIDIYLLYAKLMRYKISGKMLKMIVNIYSKVKSKVRTEVVNTVDTTVSHE